MKRSCLLGTIMILILITQFTIDTSLVSGTSEQYELFKTLARKTIQDISTERGWAQPEMGVMQPYGEKYGSAFVVAAGKEVYYEDSEGGRSKKIPLTAHIEVYADSSQAEFIFNEIDNAQSALDPDVSYEMLDEFEFHGMKARKAVFIVTHLDGSTSTEDYVVHWVFVPSPMAESSLHFVVQVEHEQESQLMPVSESLYHHAANNGIFQAGAATDIVKASFTYSISGLTVSFDASDSTGDIVECLWDFGDGKTGSGISTSHDYEKQGTYQVTLTVKDGKGNTDAAQKTVDVGDAALTLTASTDKALYITNEKIIISGNATHGSNPAANAKIDLKIRFPDGTVKTGPSTVTGVDGTYDVSYEVPKIPFETEPPKPEEFEVELKIEVTVTYTSTNLEEVKASEFLDVKVRRIWLELHGVYPVQTVTNDRSRNYELPWVLDQRYFAAEREAAVRVVVSCPSLKGINLLTLGWSLPKAKLELSTNRPVHSEVQEVIFGPEPAPVDFIFKLPPGDYALSIRLDPDLKYNDRVYEGSVHVNVKKMKSLQIEFVPLYLNMTDKEQKDAFYYFCQRQSKFMKNIYPLPVSSFRFTYEIESRKLLVPTGLLGQLNEYPFRRLAWLKCMLALNTRAFLATGSSKCVGVLPDEDGWWGPTKTGVSYPHLFIRAVLVRYGRADGTTSHEVGHTLGLNKWPQPEEYDKYPKHGREVKGLILIRNDWTKNQWRVVNLTNTKERNEAFGDYAGGRPIYCFMGNNPGGHESWVCDETYPDLFKALMDPPGEKVVYVAGLIHQNGTVQLENWYLSEGEPDPLDEGPYKIQCVSSTGEVLYSGGFGEEVEDFLAFGFAVPYPEGTTKIVIKKEEVLLKDVQATPNPPEVTVHYPNGGETIDGTSEIKWSAEDRDGDKLSYSVLYSHDGGESWMALEVDLNETDCTLASSNLPGGEQCLVKVVATDGLNTGYDVSDRFFTIANKAPFVSIISPKNGDVYQVGEVLLQGIAYDLESTELTIQWTSSQDGILGSGEELLIDELSQGEHTITFTVIDSTSKKAEEKVKIKIGSPDQPREPGDTGEQIPESSIVFIMLVTSAIMIAVIALVRRRRSRQKTTIQASVKPARYCIECGAPIPEGLAFCKCGRKIDWT